jgi:hypothetical protein
MPSQNGWADFDYRYVKRRALPQGSAFGDLNASKSFQGDPFSHTPKIGPRIGISSLNKIMKNFTTVHAICAQISSIFATWRKNFKNFT